MVSFYNAIGVQCRNTGRAVFAAQPFIVFCFLLPEVEFHLISKSGKSRFSNKEKRDRSGCGVASVTLKKTKFSLFDRILLANKAESSIIPINAMKRRSITEVCREMPEGARHQMEVVRYTLERLFDGSSPISDNKADKIMKPCRSQDWPDRSLGIAGKDFFQADWTVLLQEFGKSSEGMMQGLQCSLNS